MSELKRTLTVTELTFYSIGSIIGAGIYSVIGAAAGEAGTYLWISFVLAAIAAFITVLTYSELVSIMPKAGGEYHFLRAAFPNNPLISFMIGYLITLAAVATCSTVALSFGGYLKVFLDIPIIFSGFILLILCTAINIAGIRQSTFFSIFLICIETAGLFLIIWIGFSQGHPEKSFQNLPKNNELPNIFAATALVFFIYTGFGDIINLAEESYKPTKNVPKALLISILVVSIIYILVAIAIIGLSDPKALANSDSPLSFATKNIAPTTSKILGITALFATASTALITMISISRLLFGMAREGDMPKTLAKVLAKRHTPYIAAISIFIASCLLLPIDKVKITASLSSFSALLVFISIHVSVIILRYKKNAPKPKFKIALNIGRFPVLPFIGIIISTLLLTQFNQEVYLMAAVAILVGGIIFIAHKKWKSKF